MLFSRVKCYYIANLVLRNYKYILLIFARACVRAKGEKVPNRWNISKKSIFEKNVSYKSCRI